MNTESSVRVRIAPSPTGNIHVGLARTALFNELFARKHAGAFIIRIEDTDKKRSKPEYEQAITEGLKWIGLTWQEGPDIGGEYGPYRQSERTRLYKEVLLKLVESGAAYICYCAPKEKGGGETHTCDCSVAPGDINTAKKYVIRLRVEPQKISFTDIIRGEVSVHTDSFGGDFVIARSVDDPLFHLAVVVDDALMNITHVIRGEDHLHNTIKHILLQRACGYSQPQYAHLPLLLDEQRRKLSKRAGETNLLAYRDMGYLPQAMLNYLALLGWAPKDNQEIFSHEELVQTFSLGDVQKSGAIFSIEKLKSINKHYIRQLSPAELFKQSKPFLEQQNIDISDEQHITAALVTEQERVTTLAELPEVVMFFLPGWEADYSPEMLVWKKSTPARTTELLAMLKDQLQDISADQYSADGLQDTLLAWIDTENLGRGDTLWPMRVALTGREKSPGPFEVAGVLGKEETLRRVTIAQEKITHANIS
ncbi:MAG: glutamate--tRNA ligase [Candidatus Andersenbacteria bacterium]